MKYSMDKLLGYEPSDGGEKTTYGRMKPTRDEDRACGDTNARTRPEGRLLRPTAARTIRGRRGPCAFSLEVRYSDHP